MRGNDNSGKPLVKSFVDMAVYILEFLEFESSKAEVFSFFCRRITNKLEVLLKEILERYSVRKATSGWWGMLALISVLYDMAGEELQSAYIETLLPNILLRFVHSFIFSN